ncbi:hypothetical protein DQ181_04070 [Enterococcus faecium]|nr:hypothetical protein [Enterococcus faecium]
MIYFAGKVKKRVYGKSVSIRSLFPNIKHVYDKNGVLIARRNHPKDQLRCTAKGMGRTLKENNKRTVKAERPLAQPV